VLLVDANFRRPGILQVFPQADKVGLAEALSGQTRWEQSVQDTQVENLSIMASGPLPPNPAELLGSDLAKTIVAEMGAKYDQVIIDGPPLLLMADASVMAAMVDGVVLVVRAGANTYGIVQRCRDTLNRIGAHTMGVVLNAVRTTVGGSLQKNYEAFYDYQRKEA
jgi:capsular exopolysaccharide synthesis family protein